jgi:uncharacterized membrane protein YfcA
MTAGLVLFTIGLLGAFFSGLLGVGGAILLIPMLLYVPPLFGVAAFDMVAVGGMTIVQVLAASLAGLLAHRSAGHFAWPVAWPMGLAIAIGAALGGLGAHWVPDRALQALFAFLALAAVALMLLPATAEDDGDELPADFRPWPAAAIAGGVGLVSGLLGAGGAFLLTPLMRTVLKLPLRLIIGTSLGVVLVSAVAGTAAKALTGQIPWAPAGFLVLGALLGAPMGARVSHRVPTQLLRWFLATAIGLTALKMAWQLVS